MIYYTVNLFFSLAFEYHLYTSTLSLAELSCACDPVIGWPATT